MLENSYPIDLVVPVYNEGKGIKQVLNLLETNVKTRFRVLICYDFEEDTTLEVVNNMNVSYPIVCIKNKGTGPHSAILTGFEESNSECVIVFPGDDITNEKIIDDMYTQFLNGCEVVVASRFMDGGSMIGCPIVKSIFVRTASFSLYKLSGIPVRDASYGFRLFSRKILDNILIESSEGFTYSLELLVKCHRLGWKIGEIPASWIERKEGESRFRVFYWLSKYLRWYMFGLATTWLRRKPASVNLKTITE